MSDGLRTHITDVRTVSVPVTDVARARDFYTQTLGFEVRLDVEYGEGRHWVELAAPGAITSIALAPPGPGQAPGIDTGIRFTTEDVDADHMSLKARGADVDDEVLRWPDTPPMFQLRDPDGNLLRVVQRPRDVTEGPGGDVPSESAARKAAGDAAPAGPRFIVLVKSDAATESGALPDTAGLDEMTRFNDGLVADGAMLAGEGLWASSEGARVSFAEDGATTVTRGPFPEPEKLVAGFWIIRAASLDEAVARMREAPMGGVAQIEIRRIFEAEDFGEAFTPELREREERQRARVEDNVRRAGR